MPFARATCSPSIRTASPIRVGVRRSNGVPATSSSRPKGIDAASIGTYWSASTCNRWSSTVPPPARFR